MSARVALRRRAADVRVERRAERAQARAKLAEIAASDAQAVRAALDQLTHGHTAIRTEALLRRVAREVRDRLGLSVETGALYGALACQASLAATKPERANDA